MNEVDLMANWLQVLPRWLEKPSSDSELRAIAQRSLFYTFQPVSRLLPDSIYFGPSPLEVEPEDTRLALWLNYLPERAELAWSQNQKQLEFVVTTLHAITGLELLVILGSDGKWCVEKSLVLQGEKFILWSW